MKEGPNISALAALIGDPARANMLMALMSGKALTASELALEAGVTAQTTSTHLAKLAQGGLVLARKQGRHKYFTLKSNDVSDILEHLMGLAAKTGNTRIRTGPKDPALRYARACYTHLAGEMGVRMYDTMVQKNLLTLQNDGLVLSPQGIEFIAKIGVTAPKPLLGKPCLDWSARKNHLGGKLGSAIFSQFSSLGWIKQKPDSRIITFSQTGQRQFDQLFPITATK